MKKLPVGINFVLVLLFVSLLTATQALAEKPSKAGKEKGEKNKAKETHQKYDDNGGQGQNESHEGKKHAHFNDQQRNFIYDYYANQFQKGDCPPGLAKKHNGCMPPGQAKKWALGKRLPKDVVFYDLPSSILGYLGTAPEGHRYVRVAQDILLIAVGTGMVVDAIDNLNWEFSH